MNDIKKQIEDIPLYDSNKKFTIKELENILHGLVANPSSYSIDFDLYYILQHNPELIETFKKEKYEIKRARTIPRRNSKFHR